MSESWKWSSVATFLFALFPVIAEAALVAHYPFDVDASDATGLRDGSLESLASITPNAQVGIGALRIDKNFGSGSLVRLPALSGAERAGLRLTAFTVTLWFNMETPADGTGGGFNKFFANNADTNDGNVHINFGQASDGASSSTSNIWFGDAGIGGTGPGIPTGWVHFALTSDATGSTVYIEGQVAYTGGPHNPNGDPADFGAMSGIGRHPISAEGWNGRIDDFAVFDEVLDAGAIQDIMDNGIDQDCPAQAPECSPFGADLNGTGFVDLDDYALFSEAWLTTVGPPSPPFTSGWFDVKDFGATGNGGTDDTAAIQAAIDAAKSSGGTVYLPPGTYSVSSLNLTNTTRSLLIQGAGVNSTRIMPRQNGVHLLDLTGSAFVRLDNFQIGAFNQSIVPQTAILASQISGNFVSNALHFSNLYISGKYSVATFYCYGVPSSDMINCDFYNYEPADVAVMAFTHNNYAGVSSSFVTINPTGSNCSDWTLTACELHDLSTQTNPAPVSQATALRLDNTHQMRWLGGNISGEGAQLIQMNGTNHHITFVGPTLYSEVGNPPGMTVHNSGTVRGLSITECFNQVEDAIFGGSSGAIYDEVTYHSKPTSSSGSPTHVFDVTNGTLRNSIIHCDGLQLRMGTIEGTNMLINPGAITATTDNSFKLTP